MAVDSPVPRVLVVDVNDGTRDGFCAELRHHGYEAVAADTIRGAVVHLDNLPAVVLLSLDLDASRHAKLQFVETLPRGATLILTGKSETTARELGMLTTAFLPKPLGIDAFLEKVVESARRRRT